jgi:hypothetical protein
MTLIRHSLERSEQDKGSRLTLTWVSRECRLTLIYEQSYGLMASPKYVGPIISAQMLVHRSLDFFFFGGLAVQRG